MGEPKPTAFGRMVGAINAENELWMALVLTRYGTVRPQCVGMNYDCILFICVTGEMPFETRMEVE